MLVPAVGRARINTKLFENGSSQMTELNENGVPVGEEQVAGMRQAVQGALPQTDVLVLAGSVPPGISPDFYKQLGLLAKQRGVPFLLDAYGELLRVTVASAHASLELPGTQMCDAAGMEKRLDHVPLYQIDQWMPRR